MDESLFLIGPWGIWSFKTSWEWSLGGDSFSDKLFSFDSLLIDNETIDNLWLFEKDKFRTVKIGNRNFDIKFKNKNMILSLYQLYLK